MDSKYAIFAKNKSTSTESAPFSQNLKRKFTYGSASSIPPAKKPNLQNVPKLSNPTTKLNHAQNGSSNITNKIFVQDIQTQRRELPVFAVREQ